MSENFATGLSAELICMAVVAVALIVLIKQIDSLKKAICGTAGKPGAAPSAPASAAPQADNGELVAVIAAAVAAVMEAEAVGGKKANDFVVRSIRRVNNAPAWNRAGREEQVYSRM